MSKLARDALAQARKFPSGRCRCAVGTEYTHANLLSHVQGMLPEGWRVVPPDADMDAAAAAGFKAPSGFPGTGALQRGRPDEDVSLECQAALKDMFSGVSRKDELDYADMIEGHCETCAVVLSEQVLRALDDGAAAPTLCLAAAYASLHAELEAATTAEQVATLFRPWHRQEAAAQPGSGAPARQRLRFLQWEACLRGGVAVAAEDRNLDAWCVGLDDGGLARRIAAAARQVAATGGRAALPLYILNYIWDGDELGEDDLEQSGVETAMYSVHCIGLVLDGPSKTALLADPNGPLQKGGSMEFLSLPVAGLPRAVPPTTSCSAWDRHLARQEAAASKAKAQKKRKTKKKAAPKQAAKRSKK